MTVDIITMIGNLSQSLLKVQAMVTGLGYLVGILLFIVAIMKLKKIGDSRARGGSSEKMFVPLAYFIGGSALVFLPSAITVLSNTTFGNSNVLAYGSFNPYDILSSMTVLIKTAGVIWFVRGCILLVHASEPGVQHGPKGLAFLCAGILAVNFEATMGFVDYVVEKLMSLTSPSGN